MWLNNDFKKPASSRATASLQIIIDMLNKDLKNALSEIKKLTVEYVKNSKTR